MSQPCACLVRELDAENLRKVSAWWQALEPADKEELLRYFDPRADELSFTSHTASHQWEPLPISSIGAFVDKENIEDGRLSYQQRFDDIRENPDKVPGDAYLKIDRRKLTWRHFNWENSPSY